MNRGSSWIRWDPHIHAPGTVLNDQFPKDGWEEYLTRVEQCSPAIKVLGVTDYYVTTAYERIRDFKKEGRLPGVQLIFPNIEMRLTAAGKNGFINVHLMVCPDSDNHLAELDRILSLLTFRGHGDTYRPTRNDLLRLGKRDHPGYDDAAALKYAATQFKVDFDTLRHALEDNEWARDNICVGVAGGKNDGTSGLQEPGDAMLRAEIEKFAHIIFSSNPGDRDFWLGRKSWSEAEICAKYGSLKPCMHGSDAHTLDKIGEAKGRYTWIKGEATFDSLRQACIDPANRAFIGTEPPPIITPSKVIDHVVIQNASWAATPDVPLNPGLVAVIGARGSGKTALVDVIAHGCDATQRPYTGLVDRLLSFRDRAAELLGNAAVRVQWGGGQTCERVLTTEIPDEAVVIPRARYLSQQFVEELCSSNSVSDRLLEELERVVFESHQPEAREGAVTFAELLDIRASRFRLAREREEEAVAEASEQIAIELEKDKLVTLYDAQVKQKTAQIEAYEKDRSRFVPIGNEAMVAWHTKLTTALSQLSERLRRLNRQRQTFEAMRDEVADHRTNKAPLTLRQMRARYAAIEMSAEAWNAFLLDYKGNVDDDLTRYLTYVDGEIQKLTGTAVPDRPPGEPYVAADVSLDGLTIALITREKERVEKLLNADAETQRQYSALTTRITIETAALNAEMQRLDDARGAHARAENLTQEREAAYQRVFAALLGEERVLKELYEPLKQRLALEAGTLGKLTFSVRRVADVDKWAEEGEELYIDRRKQGPFKGKGKLIEYAHESLKTAWETGSAKDVSDAMAYFRAQHQNDLLKEAPVPRAEQADYRQWSKRFAQWLFSTDHVRTEYTIAYCGVDIRKLSPGTRGIVLLLLYLALDHEDDSPLIIDQPEENLDPKSVYEELVPIFIQAKARRQVIMVTHNANLVVNADADQVIVADATDHAPNRLPTMTYQGGGLEEASIRNLVCTILEGGEQAFRERSRRMRVEWR